MMKFIYIPSRCDVITEKGRLSSCRLYKRVAHLGHCAAERKKALLGTTEGSPPRTRVIFQCLCLSLPCREKDSQSLLSGYHTGPARTIAQLAPRLQNVLQKTPCVSNVQKTRAQCLISVLLGILCRHSRPALRSSMSQSSRKATREQEQLSTLLGSSWARSHTNDHCCFVSSQALPRTLALSTLILLLHPPGWETSTGYCACLMVLARGMLS